MPLTLPPAQNAVPAPVIRSAPTSGFSPQVLIMVRSAGVRLSDSALRTSGRFSVMTATRSRIAQSSSVVPVSMVISVVMFPLIPTPPVIARSVATKQSIFLLGTKMDCFASLAMTAYWSGARSLKLLHPGPHFQFPGPGAARPRPEHGARIVAAGHSRRAFRDRRRHPQRRARRARRPAGFDARSRRHRTELLARAADAAVDHEMRDVN